jgi:hypothetical protein
MAQDTGTPAAPAETSGDRGSTIETAIPSILSLLNPPDEGTGEGGEPEASTEAGAAEPEAQAEAQADEGEPETDATDESETDEEPAPPRKLKLPSLEEEVTLEELDKMVLRHRDYTQKTQAVAEQRKQLETEAATTAAERTKYLEGLQKYESALKELVPQEPDWNMIRAKHPEKFAETVAEWQLYQKQLADVAAERQVAEQKVAQEQAKKFEVYVQAEQQKLLEALPVLKDAAKAKTEMAAMVRYAAELGITEQELDKVADHRLFVLLHRAMTADLSRVKNPPRTTTSAGTKASPVLKPGPAAVTGARATRAEQVRKASERLAKTRSIDDAAATIFHLLPD